MADPNYFVGIDFTTGSSTNVTEDITRIDISRRMASPIARLSPGEASIALDNTDGKYGPDNQASPLAGLIRPQLPININATHDNYGLCENISLHNFTAAFNGYTSLTNAIDVLAEFTPTALGVSSAHTLVAKWSSGANKSFALQVSSGSLLRWMWSHNGVTINNEYSTAPLTDHFSTGDRVYARSMFSPTNKDGVYEIAFEISSNGANYAPLGDTIVGGASSSIDTGTDSINVGWLDPGTPDFLLGNVYFAEVRDGINGPARSQFNPNDIRALPVANGSWQSIANDTWALHSAQVLNDNGDIPFNLFTGYIDEIKLDVKATRPLTTMQCRDEVKKLVDETITTSLFTNFNIGSAFVECLSLSTVNSFAIDTLADEQPFIWFRDRNLGGALDDLAKEGFYFMFADGGGTLRVKDRYFDIDTSSDNTFATVVNSLNAFHTFDYGLSDDDIFNNAIVEGVPRLIDNTAQVIAYTTNPIAIPASSSVTFWLEYLDPTNLEPAPAIETVTPVNSTDYQSFINSAGTGTEHTATTSASVSLFSQTAKNVVYNGSSNPVWLTRYEVRGKPIHRQPRVSATADHTSSQAIYGQKSFRLSSPLLGRELHMQDYADYVVQRHAYPYPDISISRKNDFPANLTTELAQRILVSNSIAGLSSVFVIQRLEHRIDLERGLEHETAMSLAVYKDSEVLILDDQAYGKLDFRRLGF